MDTAPPPPTSPAALNETEGERRERIALEADGIAKADASIAAGLYATAAEVDAWMDSLGTDSPLPVPYPRHSRPL